LDEREGAKSLTQPSLWKKKLANLDHRPAERLLHTQIDNKRRGGVEHGGERSGLGCLLSARGWRGEGSGASARVWAAFYRPEGGEERGQEQALDGLVVQWGVDHFGRGSGGATQGRELVAWGTERGWWSEAAALTATRFGIKKRRCLHGHSTCAKKMV
jgi:hypothetical protein